MAKGAGTSFLDLVLRSDLSKPVRVPNVLSLGKLPVVLVVEKRVVVPDGETGRKIPPVLIVPKPVARKTKKKATSKKRSKR